MDDLLLYGPPGTGKTTTGINWLAERIDQDGADIYRAAFVSYTNAAVDQAKEKLAARFAVDPEEMPYSRTLHALCKRVLGITEQGWLADDQLDRFAEEYGYDLKPSRSGRDDDDLETVKEKSGADAVYLAIWDFARHRLLYRPVDGWAAFAEYNPEGTAFAPLPRFLQFVKDYEEWKRVNGLRDYTDLLTEYLRNPIPLAVSVAVVDECQDLSPLLWAVADRLFAQAEYRATLGDDDQAIYSYSGAAPELMNRRPAKEKVKLRQSYRLPRAVTRTALEIIEQNEGREPKEIIPKNEPGKAERAHYLEDLDLLNGGSWFVLVRNWRLLNQVIPVLEEEGVPYRIGGNRYSPWSDRGPLRAVRALRKLSAGAGITLAELLPFVRKTTVARGERPGVWSWGSKGKLEKWADAEGARVVTWRDMLGLGMTRWGFERLMKADLSLLTLDVSQRDLNTYENALRRGTLDREPALSVSSIHGRKGQEADHVVCLMACTGGPARAMLRPWRLEEERRVAYVGATRARAEFYGLMAQPDDGVYPYELFEV